MILNCRVPSPAMNLRNKNAQIKIIKNIYFFQLQRHEYKFRSNKLINYKKFTLKNTFFPLHDHTFRRNSKGNDSFPLFR
ncbi:hypothetical protein [Spodoptera cosmioides nucleopolyhedrovirus]|uniref:Uncharacterized protein n=1 Tax=Spodoptera cosmioides nucleopolyhedrovirus TaxID=2605774 RepID=A0A6B7KLD9_9ABAC|nr:hypothetical protein [Spodoptera cosmioides nucleopolyhedrovirus]